MTTMMEELSARVRSFICGLGGHDLLLSAEPGKLSLRCMSCPYETPGWTIKETIARPQRDSRPLVKHNAPHYV